MSLFGNGDDILKREVLDHISAMEQEPSPPHCRMFTSKVIGATKLALRLGEVAMHSNRKIMALLLVLIVIQIVGTEVEDKSLLTMILRLVFK